MNLTVKLKNTRISQYKIIKVINIVRGMKINKALSLLNIITQKPFIIIRKLLNSLVSNLENNYGLNTENYYIYQIYSNKARFYKRISERAKGRANQILKKNCHITIILKKDN